MPLPSTNRGDYADEECHRRAMSDPRLKRGDAQTGLVTDA